MPITCSAFAFAFATLLPTPLPSPRHYYRPMRTDATPPDENRTEQVRNLMRQQQSSTGGNRYGEPSGSLRAPNTPMRDNITTPGEMWGSRDTRQRLRQQKDKRTINPPGLPPTCPPHRKHAHKHFSPCGNWLHKFFWASLRPKKVLDVANTGHTA